MKPREKIMVYLAVLAAGYALIEIVAPAPQESATKAGGPETPNITQLLDQLGTTKLDARESYILKRLAADWPKAPFAPLKKQDRPEDEQKIIAQSLNLEYNGYLEAGGKTLAFINGTEYQTGDKIDDKPFVIKTITPDSITLISPDGYQTIALPRIKNRP